MMFDRRWSLDGLKTLIVENVRTDRKLTDVQTEVNLIAYIASLIFIASKSQKRIRGPSDISAQLQRTTKLKILH